MKIIIEADGPVLDVQPAYWHAYAAVLAELHLPKTDPTTFWRMIRTGADPARFITGAKPRHLLDYSKRFAELIESDEVLAHCAPQPDVADALRRIARHAECTLVTAARNRAARQELLAKHDLAVHFLRMQGLYTDPGRRPDQLRELVGDSNRVVVIAASIEVVRAATRTDLITVAVRGGAHATKRLTQAGAAETFPDLDALADDLDTGAPKLRQCGLLPAPQEANHSPFVTPDHHRTRGGRTRSYGGRRR